MILNTGLNNVFIAEKCNNSLTEHVLDGARALTGAGARQKAGRQAAGGGRRA